MGARTAIRRGGVAPSRWLVGGTAHVTGAPHRPPGGRVGRTSSWKSRLAWAGRPHGFVALRRLDASTEPEVRSSSWRRPPRRISVRVRRERRSARSGCCRRSRRLPAASRRSRRRWPPGWWPTARRSTSCAAATPGRSRIRSLSAVSMGGGAGSLRRGGRGAQRHRCGDRAARVRDLRRRRR